MAIYALLLGTKCLSSWALNPTSLPSLFKDVTWQFSPTSNFPSILELYLWYTDTWYYFLYLKKALTLSRLQLPHFFSLILYKQKSSRVLYAISYSSIPVKPILISMCFNIPPKTVKKKTSNLTVLYPRVISQIPFYLSCDQYLMRWSLPPRNTYCTWLSSYLFSWVSFESL